MKLDGRYKLETGICPLSRMDPYKIYFDYEEFVRENPDTPYCFGFAVIDTETGEIVDDFSDHVEAAFFNWYDGFPEVRHE